MAVFLSAIWALWPVDSGLLGDGVRSVEGESTDSGSSELLNPQPGTSERALAASDSHPAAATTQNNNGDIQVLVVDAQGQPVPQIPVQLVRGTALRKGKFQSKAEGTSGPSGLVTLEGSAETVEPIFGAGPKPSYWDEQGFRLGIRAALPFDLPFGAEPDHGTVWLTEKPIGPITLEIPPIGWVEVHSKGHLDESGNGIWPTWVLVRRTEEQHRGGWRTGNAVENPDQPLLLGPFGLNWKISINFSRRERMGALGYEELTGPTQPGEVLQVHLELEPTQIIEGVALNSSGQPIAGKKLKVTLCRLDQETGIDAYPTTDSEGRWFFEVAPSIEGSRLKVWVHQDPREFRGELPLIQRPNGAGRSNVGRVVLYPGKGAERILASGRVTDEAGRPLRRANISVYEILVDEGREYRAQRPLASVRTKSDGLFELSTYDEVASGRLRVYAGCKGYLEPRYQDVPFGSPALNFNFVRGGAIGAKFRIEHGIPKDQVVIRLKGKERSRKLSLIDFAWREDSCFSSLVQGDYDIRIEIRSTDWLLFESSARVESGLEMSLGEIDLRGKTQLLKLHLSDVQGKDVAQERFSLVDAEGRGYRGQIHTNKEGNVWCVIPVHSGALRLGHLKYGTVVIQPALGTIEVVFNK
jgi:hypothetical protein